jgi:ParB family transcriptional regulator, chromosome partitioning protein
MKWYDRDEMIERFLYKYQKRLSEFKSITDFRKIKAYLTLARVAGQDKLMERRFHKFLFDDSVPISSLEIDVALT